MSAEAPEPTKPSPARTRPLLPKKPSELLRVALDDLLACQKDSRYTIDMGNWHFPERKWLGLVRTCSICFAGAVIAQSLHVAPSTKKYPDDFPLETQALYALNSFRRGDCCSAFDCLGLDAGAGMKFDREIVPYADDRKAFVLQMRQMTTDLAAAGF